MEEDDTNAALVQQQKKIVLEDTEDHEIATGKKCPHLRPRSMTERVAHLLHHSQATGNVLDLTKSSSRIHVVEDNDGEDLKTLVDTSGPFIGMTNWMATPQNPSGIKRVVNDDFPYYALSEKKETLNMREAETLQRENEVSFSQSRRTSQKKYQPAYPLLLLTSLVTGRILGP